MAPFGSHTVVTAHPGFDNASFGPYMYPHGLRIQPQPQLNYADEWTECDGLDCEGSYARDHCWYFTSKEQDAKKLLSPFPYFDHSRSFIPETGPRKMAGWNKCHLLSLPKELRLEIWKYVLTDPSVPELVVGISREPSSPSLEPRVQISLQPSRNCPINLDLLLVNRFVYEEALPILYKSVRFAPLDLEGIFPLFLDSLAPYALHLICHIKLSIPESLCDSYLFGDPSRPLFHWAITCAQVAKLNETLRDVDVEGDFSVFEMKRNRRAILYPLCKIKTRKRFVPDNDVVFQQLLAEAEQELKAKAGVRKERTKAEAAERAERKRLLKQREAEQGEERKRSCKVSDTDESTGKDDLSCVPDIKEFEEELETYARFRTGVRCEDASMEDDESVIEGWDVVSVRSGASTPKTQPASAISDHSLETQTEMVPVVAYKEDMVMENDSDAGSEKWEPINE